MSKSMRFWFVLVCPLLIVAACGTTPPPSPIDAVIQTDPTPEPTAPAYMASDLLNLSVTLDQTVVADDDMSAVVLVEIEATDQPVGERPPVAMAIVLDTSGSMEGNKIRNAREAAASLIERLEVGDRITLVTYSDSATVLLNNYEIGYDRSEALESLTQIEADGNTCTSCGLENAYAILQQAPTECLRRVILMSDGHANRGYSDVAYLSSLAEQAEMYYATQTSTIGLGRLHNEALMASMANAGKADYYFLHHSDYLAQVLDRELADLHSTVVSNLVLNLYPGDGVVFLNTSQTDVYIDGYQLTFAVGQLSLGEKRQLLVELQLPQGNMGRALRAEASFTDLTGWSFSLEESARIERSNDSATIEHSIQPRVLEEYAVLTALPNIETALNYYDSGYYGDAYSLLQQSAAQLEAFESRHGSTRVEQELEQINTLLEMVEANLTPEPMVEYDDLEVRGNIAHRRARDNELMRGIPADAAYHDEPSAIPFSDME